LIEVLSSQVRIDDFLVTDVAVVAEFLAAVESGKSPEMFLASLLSLGAQVVSLGSHTAGAAKIEASIGQAQSSIKQVADTLEVTMKKQVAALTSEDGTLLTGLDAIIGQFRKDVDEMTAGENSPLRAAMLKTLEDTQNKIRKDIAEQVAGQKREIATLLDPTDPTSPLKLLADKIDGLGTALAKVQEDVTKEVAIATIVEASTVGGFDYEEVAIRAVQRIAANAGDDCEPTGSVTGRLARNKMGDGIVDLKVGATVYARIVLEAKNKALTKADWEKESEGSKANRAATGFVGLCKHVDDMPNASRILVLDARSIVVVWNPDLDDLQVLALVYQLVKMNTLSSTGQLDEVNIAEVNRNLDDALKALEKFDAITKSASAIRNAADAITKDANALRSTVADRLRSAQLAISRGIAPDEIEAAVGLLELESEPETAG
jgi:hypothetical protein